MHAHGRILIPLLIISFGIGGCDNPLPLTSNSNSGEEESTEGVLPDSVFPINRKLTNADGNTIDATIIGRDVSTVALVRRTDQKEFTYPIAKLSKKDKAFIETLPLYAVESLMSGRRASGPIDSVKSELARIEREIEENRLEATEYESESLKGRALRKEREGLLEEKSELIRELRRLETNGL